MHVIQVRTTSFLWYEKFKQTGTPDEYDLAPDSRDVVVPTGVFLALILDHLALVEVGLDLGR